MQKKNARRTNAQRSEEMRAMLVRAARELFVEKGYVDTSTPEIVKAADVTRGALYHHFRDKADLFRAVVQQEAEHVAEAIEQGSSETGDPLDQLLMGADAYFDAMNRPGRIRLLLIDGPAVLGSTVMQQIFLDQDQTQLRLGLQAALGEDTPLPLDALTDIVSAAFDRAVLAIDDGGDGNAYRRAIRALLSNLAPDSAASQHS